MDFTPIAAPGPPPGPPPDASSYLRRASRKTGASRRSRLSGLSHEGGGGPGAGRALAGGDFMPDDSLWSPPLSSAAEPPPPRRTAAPSEGRSIESGHLAQSLVPGEGAVGVVAAAAPEVVVVVHEKDSPLEDKAAASNPWAASRPHQPRPQRQAALQSWWDAVSGAAGTWTGAGEAFPHSRSPEGLPRAEAGRDLFGPDRRQTLATISETLGAINTVGRYLVNYTRSNSSGGGGGGGGASLGLATTLLGTPTVLSDGTEHEDE